MKTSLAQRRAMKRWHRRNRARCRIYTYKNDGLCYVRRCHSISALKKYRNKIDNRIKQLENNKRAVTN